MHEQNYSLTDAMKWISDFNDKLVDTFLSTLKELPSFGDPTLDKDVAMYIDGIANWVRSNDSWSFEVRQLFVDGGNSCAKSTNGHTQCERYFGKKGLEIQETRIVNLLPKKAENRSMTRLTHRQGSISSY